MNSAIILVIFAVNVVATAVLTPVFMMVARRVGAVDRGGYRKTRRGEIPLLGGLSIAVPLLTLSISTTIAGQLILRNWRWVWRNYEDFFDPLFSIAAARGAYTTFALGGIIIVLLGVADDLKALRARWKLLGQVVVALFLCLAGNTITNISLPWIGPVELGLGVGGIVTMMWVVGLINAFNLIDGIDGLAAGIAFVGAAALAVLGFMQDNMGVAIAGAALMGSLLGFLMYNFPPAKVFLGDTGSMFLGYTLALMTLQGAQKSEAAVILLAPMMALGLPVFETLTSIARRYLRGVPIFAGDNRHIHHRFLNMGYSQPRVVLTLCGAALSLAFAAILSAILPQDSRWTLLPYGLYAGTLLYIASLAGYLRPSAIESTFKSRERNRIFQAFGRYAALRVSVSLREETRLALFKLCRHELGLQCLEIRIASGACLWKSSETTGTEECREQLHVKSADDQDLLIRYEFAHHPDETERQDVAACLAAIFDQLRIESPVLNPNSRVSPPGNDSASNEPGTRP